MAHKEQVVRQDSRAASPVQIDPGKHHKTAREGVSHIDKNTESLKGLLSKHYQIESEDVSILTSNNNILSADRSGAFTSSHPYHYVHTNR